MPRDRWRQLPQSSVGSGSRAKPETIVFAGILATFVLLSIVYNWVTPAGEGVDEVPHFEFTSFVKTRRALPIVPFSTTSDTVLMGHHPPLYYVVAALLIAPLATSDLDQALPPNPHFIWIEGSGPGNRNVFLHSATAGGDPFPWHGVVLAIHLLRLWSTVQGVAALIASRALLRLLIGTQPGLVLAATAATAFQPTFLSMFSLAHHDGTVGLFGILGILWCVHYAGRPPAAQSRAAGLVGGLILGLGALTKTSALALGPVYAVAFAAKLVLTREWRQTALTAVLAGGTAVAIAGWWYARNVVLYGDPLAQNVFAATHPSLLRVGPYGWGDVIAFVEQLRRTFWGAFGYMNLLVDQRVGDFFWLVVGVALPGFALVLVDRRRDRAFLVCWAIAGSAVISLLGLFLRYSYLVGGVGHGRFFIAIIPIVVGMAVVGLGRLLPARWPVGPAIFATGLGAFAALAPFLVILPAYRPPLATSAEPQAAQPAGVSYGGQLTLVADSLDPFRVAPGGSAQETLYWRLAGNTSADLRYRIRAIARDGTVFFDKTFWPAGGGIPTYTWPADATYRDVVSIPVPENVVAGLARLDVSVTDQSGRLLEPSAVSVSVGSLPIAAIPKLAGLPPEAVHLSAHFADWLDLNGYALSGAVQPGGRLGVQLYWQAIHAVPIDATVSVQLVGPNGQLVAQDDAEPARGRAPTSTWAAGDLVLDEHSLTLPGDLGSGQYRVVVVVYTRPALARLPVRVGSTVQDYLELSWLARP